MSKFNTNYQKGGDNTHIPHIFHDEYHKINMKNDDQEIFQRDLYSLDEIHRESSYSYGEQPQIIHSNTNQGEGYFIIRPRQKDMLNKLYHDVHVIKKFLKTNFGFKPEEDTETNVDTRPAKAKLDGLINSVSTNTGNIEFDPDNKEETSAALALLLTKWMKGDDVPDLKQKSS